MPARARRCWIGALVVTAALAAPACSTSSKGSSSTGTNGGTSAASATATGVTADTIKIGFTYPDLEALAKTGLIKVDNGPYGPMLRALVDDINTHGGVRGRKLQPYIEKFSVLTNADQLALCTKLTEDNAVFAVLGGLVADNNLCISQQHSTVLISGYGSGFNSTVLAKARAPWVTWNAGDDRAFKALVRILDQQGRLKGKMIGVYGTTSASKPLIDLTVASLKHAGYTVRDTAINDAPPSDLQAANALDKVIGGRFKDQHIDTVIATLPPGSNFDNIGYYPTFYAPQTSVLAAGAYTNPYGKFPLIGGLAASANQDEGYDTPEMRHCRDVWKRTTGMDIKPYSEELKDGKSSGFSAMTTACATLRIFVEAAKAAGANLTPQTWEKGLASLGRIALPGVPAASFGRGKLDGQDSFQLMRFNPAWKAGSSEPQFLPLGDPITLTS
jgi:hypothetical protein